MAAHMASLRRQSAEVGDGQNFRDLACASAQGSRLSPIAASSDASSGGHSSSSPFATTSQLARSGSGKAARSATPPLSSSPASTAPPPAAVPSGGDAVLRDASDGKPSPGGWPDPVAAARAQACRPLDDPAAARNVVGSYMEQLRQRSVALTKAGAQPRQPLLATRADGTAGSFAAMREGGGSGSGADLLPAGGLRSLRAGSASAAEVAAARAASTGSSGSEEGHSTARAAVAPHTESLHRRSSGSAWRAAGTSVRSSGSLRSGSLRLASLPCGPSSICHKGLPSHRSLPSLSRRFATSECLTNCIMLHVLLSWFSPSTSCAVCSQVEPLCWNPAANRSGSLD